jgi:tRNA 2-selenouridine synthase SelU
VIDLEGLANHRGSAFGDRSSAAANNEQFENNLFSIVQNLIQPTHMG